MVVTDAWSGYNGLGALGYDHLPVAQADDPKVAEEYLPIIHLFSAISKRGCTARITGQSAQASANLPQRVHVSL